MRVRRSFLLMLLLVTCVGALRYPRWHDRLLTTWSILRQSPSVRDVSVGQAYQLRAEWLTFPVSSRASAVRILTNAALERPLPSRDFSVLRPGWRYEIEYRLLDQDNRILKRGKVHFRTKVVQYVSVDSPEPFTRSHFDHPHLVPARARRLRVELDRLSGHVAQLQARLIARDSAISQVVARVASQVERIDYDDPGLWQRLSRWRKERLCRAAIYPPELLSLQQRTSVLRWQWSPTAPLGVEGRDYQRLTLFSRNSVDGIELESRYVPSEVPLLPELRRIVRLPPFKGTATIAVRPAKSYAGASKQTPPHATRKNQDEDPNTFLVTWVDSEHQLRATRRLLVDTPAKLISAGGSFSSAQIETIGGWLDMSATVPMSVRVSWQEHGPSKVPIDLSSEPAVLRTYPCGEEKLRFRIGHTNDQPTPVRLSARRILFAGTRPADCLVHWALLDSEGATLESDAFLLPATPSEFDWAQLDDPRAKMSDPQHRYWLVPPAAEQLVLTATGDSPLVAVASRPAHLPSQTVVTTSDAGDKGQPPLRKWFPLRPEAHDELVRHQRTQLVRLGARPPTVDPAVQIGNFRWEDFQPEGAWAGRVLLLPRASNRQVRDEALANSYFELALRRTQSVNIRSASDQPVDLSCALIAQGRGPTSLLVKLDNVTVGQLTSASQHAVLKIPQVVPGTHELRVDASPDARVLVNHIDRTESARFISRLGIEIGKHPQSFLIEKRSSGQELLMLDYFFRSDETTPRVVLWAGLREDSLVERPTLQAFTEWHPTSWEFHIDRPEPTRPRGFVLGTPGQQVAMGRRCFLWLGENVPPGDVELTVKTNSQTSGYAVLSRVIPGQFPRRRIYRTAPQ